MAYLAPLKGRYLKKEACKVREGPILDEAGYSMFATANPLGAFRFLEG